MPEKFHFLINNLYSWSQLDTETATFLVVPFFVWTLPLPPGALELVSESHAAVQTTLMNSVQLIHGVCAE